MRIILLLLICLSVCKQFIFAQETPLNIHEFLYDNQKNPHIHLHNRGYLYVDLEFLNPINDRGNLLVLDSSVYVQTDITGDTLIVLTNIYTISENNRIEKIEFKEYTQGNPNRLTNYTNFYYEMQGDSLIQIDTSYYINEDGIVIPSHNRILHINSNGLITYLKQQNYIDGSWVNRNLAFWEFNELGCQIVFNEYRWGTDDWYQLFRRIGVCDEELVLNELFNGFENFGETEYTISYLEFLYNEDRKIESITEYFPSWDDPEIFDVNSLTLYTNNEEGLKDTVTLFLWNFQLNDFKTTRFTIHTYDEQKNIVNTEIYRLNNSNMFNFAEQRFSIFDNTYLNGDFLSGGVNSEFNSMLLNYKVTNFEDYINETQYFYSLRSVNTTEKFENFSFEIYPNPSSGDLNINISDIIDDKSQILIRNSTGAVVLSQIAENKNSFDLANLPSGFYLVSIEGANFRSEVKKLIVR